MSEQQKATQQKQTKARNGGCLIPTLGLFTIFGGAVYLMVTAEPEVSPYGTTAHDEVQPVVNLTGNISRELASEGSYARSLPDGLHIVHDEDSGDYKLVAKFYYFVGDKAYGFFGMDDLPEEYVPYRDPSAKGEGHQLWTIASMDSLVSDDMKPGFYNYTIKGEVLNGKDLSFTMLYDDDFGVDKGYGYMGLTVKPSF